MLQVREQTGLRDEYERISSAFAGAEASCGATLTQLVRFAGTLAFQCVAVTDLLSPGSAGCVQEHCCELISPRPQPGNAGEETVEWEDADTGTIDHAFVERPLSALHTMSETDGGLQRDQPQRAWPCTLQLRQLLSNQSQRSLLAWLQQTLLSCKLCASSGTPPFNRNSRASRGGCRC